LIDHDLVKRVRTAFGDECTVALFGSRVYGTDDRFSDHDFMILYKGSRNFGKSLNKRAAQLNQRTINLHVYAAAQFQAALYSHEPIAVELWMLPSEFVLQGPHPDKICWWQIDHGGAGNFHKFHHAFTKNVQSTWKKAEKRFWIDRRSSLKCVFHALRTLEFGVQIAKQGRITNWRRMNHVLAAVHQPPCVEWSQVGARFHGQLQELTQEFNQSCRSLSSSRR